MNLGAKRVCEPANVYVQNFNIRISLEIRVEYVKGKTVIVSFIVEVSPHFEPVYIKNRERDRGAYKRFGFAGISFCVGSPIRRSK